MRRLEGLTYRCACGTTYEEVRGEGGDVAEEVYNELKDEWQNRCPYCGVAVGCGELEETPALEAV